MKANGPERPSFHLLSLNLISKHNDMLRRVAGDMDWSRLRLLSVARVLQEWPILSSRTHGNFCCSHLWAGEIMEKWVHLEPVLFSFFFFSPNHLQLIYASYNLSLVTLNVWNICPIFDGKNTRKTLKYLLRFDWARSRRRILICLFCLSGAVLFYMYSCN